MQHPAATLERTRKQHCMLSVVLVVPMYLGHECALAAVIVQVDVWGMWWTSWCCLVVMQHVQCVVAMQHVQASSRYEATPAVVKQLLPGWSC
jgi:hypothetical protein